MWSYHELRRASFSPRGRFGPAVNAGELPKLKRYLLPNFDEAGKSLGRGKESCGKAQNRDPLNGKS